MTCHFGLTTNHVGFSLAHLAMLAWFIRASLRVPTLLRTAVCLLAIAAMGYHTLLATVCSSESIAGVVYGHWEKESRARIRLVLVSVAVSMLCTIASKLISSMDCTGKFVRLAVVNFPAVISAFPTYYWWHYDCEEWLFRRIRLCMLCSVLSSLFFIQSSTKSSVLTFSMCAVLVLGVVPGVLSAGIEWDTTGRLLPLSPSDEVHPHWAPLLYYFVWDSAYVILSAAISHAVAGHSYSQPVPSAPFAAQSITKPNALMWLVLPVLISAVFYSLNAPSTLEWGSQMPWYTNTRQLLGTELDGTMPSHLINIFNISLAALAIASFSLVAMRNERGLIVAKQKQDNDDMHRLPAVPSCAKVLRPANIPNEIRAYVRFVAHFLIRQKMLKEVVTLSDLPREYWSQSQRKRTSNCLEFVGTKELALKFARKFFLPLRLNAAVLGDTDACAFCSSLQGPVLHYSRVQQALQPGPWMPVGLSVETEMFQRCTKGSGRRTAHAILNYYFPMPQSELTMDGTDGTQQSVVTQTTTIQTPTDNPNAAPPTLAYNAVPSGSPLPSSTTRIQAVPQDWYHTSSAVKTHHTSSPVQNHHTSSSPDIAAMLNMQDGWPTMRGIELCQLAAPSAHSFPASMSANACCSDSCSEIGGGCELRGGCGWLQHWSVSDKTLSTDEDSSLPSAQSGYTHSHQQGELEALSPHSETSSMESSLSTSSVPCHCTVSTSSVPYSHNGRAGAHDTYCSGHHRSMAVELDLANSPTRKLMSLGEAWQHAPCVSTSPQQFVRQTEVYTGCFHRGAVLHE